MHVDQDIEKGRTEGNFWMQVGAKGMSGYMQAQRVTRKPYGFMQSSFWVIMMVHVMVCGDL